MVRQSNQRRLSACSPPARSPPDESALPEIDKPAGLHVPETLATRVARTLEEPVLRRNVSKATPLEQSQFQPELLDEDECVGPACLELSSTLRSKLDFTVDLCYDFYQYVCGKFAPMDTFSEVANTIKAGEIAVLKSRKVPASNQTAIQKAAAMYKACVSFASSYMPETIELVRWMIAMNLDFYNTTRLEIVDPVQIMIDYSKEQEAWLIQRSKEYAYENEDYYGLLFLMSGIPRGQHLALARKMLAYEEHPQWAAYFYDYTEGTYGASDFIVHYIHSTRIIRTLFEHKDIGKRGLQYLVAWGLYRQLAEFPEPVLFHGDREADESCYVHVKNVMNLVILSHHVYSCRLHEGPELIELADFKLSNNIFGQDERNASPSRKSGSSSADFTRVPYMAYLVELLGMLDPCSSSNKLNSEEEELRRSSRNKDLPPEYVVLPAKIPAMTNTITAELTVDECVGPLCRYITKTLRSKLDFYADPCNDFYQYVCGKFRGTYISLQTMELVRWMTAMNLDLVNTGRLEKIDPVEMMVRGSLDLGVEVIISIRLYDRWFYRRKRVIQVRQRNLICLQA
ncbi:hypothetical protein MRX96_057834 [Rhipicephalus microplus]